MLCGCRNGHTQQRRATNPHDRPSSEQSAVDIYQAELDYRTASAHNDTKTYCSFNTHTELQATLLTLVLQAWYEHTDAVVQLWSSSVPKPP